MFRTFIPAIALFIAVPALALDQGSATLAAPAKVDKLAASDGVWTCSGSDCTGPASAHTASAIAACAAVAENAGRVTVFTAGATTLDEASLVRCNRRARS